MLKSLRREPRAFIGQVTLTINLYELRYYLSYRELGYRELQCNKNTTMQNKKIVSPSFILHCAQITLSLHKIGGTRTSESKLSCRSFALSLHKTGGIRKFESKILCRSFALSLHKIRLYTNAINIHQFT